MTAAGGRRRGSGSGSDRAQREHSGRHAAPQPFALLAAPRCSHRVNRLPATWVQPTAAHRPRAPGRAPRPPCALCAPSVQLSSICAPCSTEASAQRRSRSLATAQLGLQPAPRTALVEQLPQALHASSRCTLPRLAHTPHDGAPRLVAAPAVGAAPGSSFARGSAGRGGSLPGIRGDAPGLARRRAAPQGNRGFQPPALPHSPRL